MQQAKEDSRVKAVALDLDSFTGGGQTAMGDLANAIREVRSAGKPVIAYATGYTNDSYQLAAAASEVWLNPLGGVVVTGPGGSNLYYKGLLDKLGVTANVYRVGTYKSAVEPFIRNDMSPEAKQNYMALDQAGWNPGARASTRRGPRRTFDLFLQNMNGAIAMAGGDMAKAARQRRSRRPHRRPPANSKLGWPSSAERTAANAPVTSRIKLAHTSPTRSIARPRDRSASSRSPA